MDDTIYRQAAIEAVRNMWGIVSPISDDVLLIDKAQVQTELMMLPAAEPRKGKWEEKQDNDWAGGGAWVCSECGYGYAFGAYLEAFEFDYCPNCGARMEE